MPAEATFREKLTHRCHIVAAGFERGIRLSLQIGGAPGRIRTCGLRFRRPTKVCRTVQCVSVRRAYLSLQRSILTPARAPRKCTKVGHIVGTSSTAVTCYAALMVNYRVKEGAMDGGRIKA